MTRDRPASAFPPPTSRRLRVYAFDPRLSTHPGTSDINQAVISLPWEEPWEKPVGPGPVNDYLEVVDVDPSSGVFYEGLDLNDPHLLAQDGLAPSEADPRFHQQMVFAVAMNTIKTFERALGRKVLWAPRWEEARSGKAGEGRYLKVSRLRVYPHALREANAYYSRTKKALMFGYFPASSLDAGARWVFTALSHDIIVHETTHAILDGLHRRYGEPTSIDSLAFHEAFADIVALFSHFNLGDALRQEIAAQGGRLDARSLMSGLALQFGKATGHYAALREAIDDPEKNTPEYFTGLTEPHARGAVVVAALFDAFLTIYERRIADLMRIAGVQVQRRVRQQLHPDLVERLAKEASKSADHLLRMCIRALDYMPPVDARFGDFLRAIITADTDLIPDDRLNYRTAVIEGFRKRGIVPDDCMSLAPASLLWDAPEQALSTEGLLGRGEDTADLNLDALFNRDQIFEVAERNRFKVWNWLIESENEVADMAWEDALGIFFVKDRPARRTKDKPHWNLDTVSDWAGAAELGRETQTAPAVEVHSVRACRRMGPDGQDLRQLVIEITQRRRGYFDDKVQAAQDGGEAPLGGSADFIFRGGATLIVDLRSQEIRYIIRKRIGDDVRMREQAGFLKSQGIGGLGMAYRDQIARATAAAKEPFALLHREG